MRGRTATLIAVAMFVLDQFTKNLIVDRYHLGESRPLIPGFFSLTYVRNRGGAFGLLADLPGPTGQIFFIVFAIGALVLLARMLRGTPRSDVVQRFALTSVIGGAAGNLYDRIRYGEVVDFLDVYVGDWHWPAFNLADSFISVGVVLLLAGALSTHRAQGRDAAS